jgi:hypothetical protein
MTERAPFAIDWRSECKTFSQRLPEIKYAQHSISSVRPSPGSRRTWGTDQQPLNPPAVAFRFPTMTTSVAQPTSGMGRRAMLHQPIILYFVSSFFSAIADFAGTEPPTGIMACS